jgi:mitochondrial enoyl-[acyl-carrier protein] reductase / trans-2-enoyl-CoA reductase
MRIRTSWRCCASIPPTAALLLSECADLSPGDWEIQKAGNSGVGRSVIAFANERRLHTASLVRWQELLDDLLTAGSNIVLIVLVDGPELPARVAAATGEAPIRLALDGVGGAAMMALSSCLAPGGILVSSAFMSKRPGVASPADLIFRQVTIRGFWLETP